MAADVAGLLDLLTRYGYVIVFVAGLAEGIPLLGVFLPGQAVILVAGALAATGRLDLTLVILSAVPAGILGDAIGYHIGRSYGRRFLEKYGRLVRIEGKQLAKSDRLFEKYGILALIFGRFSFLTRGVVALLAGVSRVPKRVFWPVNILGGILWALGFVFLGYAFGYAFLELEGRVGRILAFTLLALVGIYALYRILRKFAPQFTRDDLGMALVGIAGGATFGLLADLVADEGGANRLDAAHAAYVDALAPLAPLLSVVTMATSLATLGLVALALLAFLAYKRRTWEAALVGLGVGGVIVLVAILRPALPAPDGHEAFPSEHASAGLVLAGAVAYIVAAHARRPWVALASAVGLALFATLSAHALLGATERPTDVLGGLALGATWLALSILLVEFGLKRGEPADRAASEG